MLTELHRRLHSLLSVLPCPVWQEDCVPAGTAFPYATVCVAAETVSGQSGGVTVTLWFQSGTAHSDRLALADRLLRCFPPDGLLLRLDGGLAVIRRTSGLAFRKEGDALCAAVHLELRLYGNA